MARKIAARTEEKEKLLEEIPEKLKGGGVSKKVVADSWSNIRIVKCEAISEAENILAENGYIIRVHLEVQNSSPYWI